MVTTQNHDYDSNTCIYVYMYICIYAYTSTYIHIYIYIHICLVITGSASVWPPRPSPGGSHLSLPAGGGVAPDLGSGRWEPSLASELRGSGCCHFLV